MLHRLPNDQPVSLATITSDGKAFHNDRRLAEKEFKRLRRRLADLQMRLYAEDKHAILIVLQAMDAGGKDGTIRRVFQGVNPQGVRVTSFKQPSRLELAHDFLWRVHREVPPRGMIGVFNRSHYEDVLVVRVHSLVPEETWRPRYELINDFEKMLVTCGTTILKFYLHISKEEQRQRFQERIDIKEKNWKFSFEDLKKREQWDEYLEAYEEMLNRTNTSWAPWHVIPADRNWYRNLAVVRTIVSAIEELDPRYPEPEGDVSGLTVPA
jgi:PPK2 family polyphosphate:nucleotide phosphotransferase